MKLIDADEYYKEICRVFPCKYRDDENIRRATKIGLSNMPTVEAVPLSVIEKIHDAIDNADSDGFLEDEHGYYIGSMLTKEHVDEIIDKAVKECTHDKG